MPDDHRDAVLPDPASPGLDPWPSSEQDPEHAPRVPLPDAVADGRGAATGCCGGSGAGEPLADLLALARTDTAPTSPWWHREALEVLGVANPPADAADLFDAWAGDGPAVDRGDDALSLVGAPQSALAGPLAAGDVVVLRTPGMPHASLTLVVDPRLVPVPAGYGVRTVGGARGAAQVRVVGTDGRVPPHVLVLRGRAVGVPDAEGVGVPGDPESVPGPCPDVVVLAHDRPRLLLRGSVHPAVREVQRKLNAYARHRVAAGAPGLPGVPLVEDCVFGRHTADAVLEFQRATMPGAPREHDAKVGTRTWAQLDAVAMPTPGGPATVTVRHLRFATDGFARALTWDDVVGLDTATVNLEVSTAGMPVATMPDHVVVTLGTRPPDRATGATTVPTPVPFEVSKVGPEPAREAHTLYRRSVALPDVGLLLQVERRHPEVATVVRAGGTSDARLRAALGWAPRGAADQPTRPGVSTGSEARERPDAMALLRAGGVEVLEARVGARPGWAPADPAVRLVRSPADLVYYSGHGLGSGMLAIDTESRQCPERGTYVSWIGPAALGWRSPMDVDVLVLAGCSVLHVDTGATPPTGPGLAWAGLLTGRGGPLAAVLGYRAPAPCDSKGGDDIAEAFGRRLAAGSRAFVQDWLEVNMAARATNAAAVDARGYWWIERTWGGLGREIAGPRALP